MASVPGVHYGVPATSYPTVEPTKISAEYQAAGINHKVAGEKTPSREVGPPGIESQNEPHDQAGNAKSDVDYSFLPEDFNRHRKYNDIFWCILFWLNVIATVILICVTNPFQNLDYISDGIDLTRNQILFIGVISIGTSLAYSFLALIFMWSFPSLYIKAAVFVIIGLVFLCVIPLMIFLSVLFIIFGGLIAIVLGIFIWKTCGNATHSANIMRASVLILRQYPSIFFFDLIMLIVQSAISYIFSIEAVAIYAKSYSLWIYLYLVVSFAWISKTLTYVTYMTCSGVAFSWYCYNGTKEMPPIPILLSFWHSITSSFGACALAGMIEGTFEAFQNLTSDSTASAVKCCCCCLVCCCNCVRNCAECLFGIINRYSLIYCGMFGVSSREAVKKWKSLSDKKVIKSLTSSSIIDLTFNFYSYAAFIIGAAIGGIACYLYFGVKLANLAFVMATAAACAYNGLQLVCRPIEVLSDSLFIGFSEYPEKLKTGARQLYDVLDAKTKEMMDKEIQKSQKKKEKESKP